MATESRERAMLRTSVPTDDVALDTFEETLDPHRETSATDDTSQMARGDVLRIVAVALSFFFAGTNDGSLGALTPYILRDYHRGTDSVALMLFTMLFLMAMLVLTALSYVSTFLGWVLAAGTNSYIIRYVGLGSVLTLGAVLQLTSHLLRFWRPPFGLYVVTFLLQALGMAYQDSNSNTFVTSVRNAHRWLGFIHAMYALGCLVSPIVATAMASQNTDRWTFFYLFLTAVGIVNLAGVLFAFRDSLTIDMSATTAQGSTSRTKMASRDIIATLKSPPVYLLSLFYFFMLGVGIMAGGWVVEYLVSDRNGKLPDVGYVSAGLWGGIFLGRMLLAEPTYRFGEKRMSMLYCLMILVMALIFWLVPNIISSAVTICVFGFFFGPLFATGMSIGSKLFEKRIQPTALGFVFVLAQAGGALFPALTGIIARKAGLKIMQPILIGLIVAMGIAWMLVPTVSTSGE